jgi:hypothetical protein
MLQHGGGCAELNVATGVADETDLVLSKRTRCMAAVISLSRRDAALTVYASGELTHAYVHRPLSSRLSGRRRCRLSAHDQSKMEHGLHVAIRDVDCN